MIKTLVVGASDNAQAMAHMIAADQPGVVITRCEEPEPEEPELLSPPYYGSEANRKQRRHSAKLARKR